MVTNKERIALRRKARSADQVEADRATDRKRMAYRRKARAANQVEADRAADQKRMALPKQGNPGFVYALDCPYNVLGCFSWPEIGHAGW